MSQWIVHNLRGWVGKLRKNYNLLRLSAALQPALPRTFCTIFALFSGCDDPIDVIVLCPTIALPHPQGRDRSTQRSAQRLNRGTICTKQAVPTIENIDIY
jgi:hypothetical protein